MEGNADVVVVGAGPVGLLTAIELTLGGVRVVVLERLATPSVVAKALMIGPLGIEALQRRGMAASIAAAEQRVLSAMQRAAQEHGPDVRRGHKYVGHFAGMTLLRADAQKEPERRGRPVDQESAEAMLAERARQLGVEVRRRCEVNGFIERDGGVEITYESPEGESRIRCSWIVGCDGGRSTIRKMAGFEFPGTPATMAMYQAVVELDDPERRLPSGWRRTSTGVFSYGFLPGKLVMLDFSGPPEDRQAPVTRQEIEDQLRRISGEDVRVKALESGSRWPDNTRLADRYRRGQVLLAGDAAHIHSPFGGQGMGLGLVDAANLGWKLAAVVRGEMPEALLDSYTTERRPVAEAVLANTLAQMAIMRPVPQSGAMRDLVAKLLEFDDVNQFIGEMMSGLFVRYELGSSHDDVGRVIGNRSIRDGDVELPLYDLMQDGMGVLLDASNGKHATRIAEATTPRIRCVAVESGTSMLIRPDACIAWIGEENSTDGLERALHSWFRPVQSL